MDRRLDRDIRLLEGPFGPHRCKVGGGRFDSCVFLARRMLHKTKRHPYAAFNAGFSSRDYVRLHHHGQAVNARGAGRYLDLPHSNTTMIGEHLSHDLIESELV